MASSGKIKTALRTFKDRLKRALKKYKITYYPLKFVKKCLRGALYFVAKFRQIDYSKISSVCRKAEESTVFPQDIKFSILVPLYNTPIRYLKEMIDSVRNQTYKNFELCLADGSDAEHQNVRQTVEEYMAMDNRIVYKKLEKNMGISENTNECMRMATGNYIALFDHDDVLHPSVLFENMKAICYHGADFIYTDEATFAGNNIKRVFSFHFKPDYAVDNLRANNYICHFSAFSRELLDKAGMFRTQYDGSQDHDMILRLTSNAKKVFHIRKLLYFWRSHPNSVAGNIESKPYAIKAGITAVQDNVINSGCDCTVESSKAYPTIYRIKYKINGNPLISIIIPNMNHVEDLKRCVTSIIDNTTYGNYEIVVVENNSTEQEIFEYYNELEKLPNVRIIKYEGSFNYSDINNKAVAAANGDYVLLLNNDTKVISPSWLEEMLMFAQRSDVGAVGAKLLYPNNTIQHGGIIVGLGGYVGYANCGCDYEDTGYMGKLHYGNNVSAVTAACMMVRKDVFNQIGGLDTEFAVAFNDVDFCLRLREKGYLIVMTPYAELYHHESKSRGADNTPEKKALYDHELALFANRWKKVLEDGDPYYNPNFSMECYEDYKINYRKINIEKRKAKYFKEK